MIKYNPPLWKEIRREMSPNSGLKSSKLSELIKESHLSEGLENWIRKLSIGMLMRRLIKKEQITSYASLARHKLMSGWANRQKARDKSDVKCKRRVYLLILEMISWCNLKCISIQKCGSREEMRLPYLYKDWPEDGLRERGQAR